MDCSIGSRKGYFQRSPCVASSNFDIRTSAGIAPAIFGCWPDGTIETSVAATGRSKSEDIATELGEIESACQPAGGVKQASSPMRSAKRKTLAASLFQEGEAFACYRSSEPAIAAGVAHALREHACCAIPPEISRRTGSRFSFSIAC